MEREKGHTSEVKGQGSIQVVFKKELVKEKQNKTEKKKTEWK